MLYQRNKISRRTNPVTRPNAWFAPSFPGGTTACQANAFTGRSCRNMWVMSNTIDWSLQKKLLFAAIIFSSLLSLYFYGYSLLRKNDIFTLAYEYKLNGTPWGPPVVLRRMEIGQPIAKRFADEVLDYPQIPGGTLLAGENKSREWSAFLCEWERCHRILKYSWTPIWNSSPESPAREHSLSKITTWSESIESGIWGYDIQMKYIKTIFSLFGGASE